jgi:dihydrolipoamide dehydrogenase
MAAQFDLIIIGGGPGGYVAAIRAAQLGARVALVEKWRIGGTCLNVGCIPTKALLTAAGLYAEAKRGDLFGVEASGLRVNMATMMRYKQAMVDKLVGAVEELLEVNAVTVWRGTGSLLQAGLIRVATPTGERHDLAAGRIIVATGSVAAPLPVPGADLPGVIDSSGALELAEIPQSIVIIGGGVIGVEFASLYNMLGSRVTILEMMPVLLPGICDEMIARRLLLALTRQGIDVHTDAEVQATTAASDGTLAVLYTENGKEAQATGRYVLVAVGRRPYSAGLGLEALGVALNGGAVKVNEYLETSVPGFYAIGDVTGPPMLAHAAMVEGRLAAENALQGNKRRMDYKAIPNAIFSYPEVAVVGLSGAEARRRGYKVKTGQFPLSSNPRAAIMEQGEGLVELVCEAGSGRVLGMEIIGPRATDLIAEGALAVATGATAADIAWTAHTHPTLAEAVLEAALDAQGASIHHAVSRQRSAISRQPQPER